MTTTVGGFGVGEWAVWTSGLVKRLGNTTAVNHVDLRVRIGSVHGLLGPNGAGKTTLLRMVFGLIRPDAGELRVFDRTWAEAGHRVLDDVGGFVDGPRFYPYLTGYRSLEMLAEYDGTAGAEAVNAALATVGLRERAHEKTARYSLGMRQRLGIAAALLRSPRLLVLDEPANGLDPAGARDMRALVRRLADDGLTVIMSTHVMSDVEALCDDVTILRAGTLAYGGPVEQLREQAPSPAYRMVTSDDDRATVIAPPALRVRRDPDGGLAVYAAADELDRYVIGLGRAGIAVRALTLSTTPLEALFFRLTETGPPTGPQPRRPAESMTAPTPAAR